MESISIFFLQERERSSLLYYPSMSSAPKNLQHLPNSGGMMSVCTTSDSCLPLLRRCLLRRTVELLDIVNACRYESSVALGVASGIGGAGHTKLADIRNVLADCPPIIGNPWKMDANLRQGKALAPLTRRHRESADVLLPVGIGEDFDREGIASRVAASTSAGAITDGSCAAGALNRAGEGSGEGGSAKKNERSQREVHFVLCSVRVWRLVLGLSEQMEDDCDGG